MLDCIQHLKKLKYIPLALLVLVYVAHSIEGFMGAEAFFTIVEVLGLPAVATAALVYFVGLLDMAVAIMLIFKDKIVPALPWGLVFLWAGLWPWVPRAMEWYGGLPSAYTEAAMISVFALASYAVHKKLANW